jgi:hypothetical protein
MANHHRSRADEKFVQQVLPDAHSSCTGPVAVNVSKGVVWFFRRCEGPMAR